MYNLKKLKGSLTNYVRALSFFDALLLILCAIALFRTLNFSVELFSTLPPIRFPGDGLVQYLIPLLERIYKENQLHHFLLFCKAFAAIFLVFAALQVKIRFTLPFGLFFLLPLEIILRSFFNQPIHQAAVPLLILALLAALVLLFGTIRLKNIELELRRLLSIMLVAAYFCAGIVKIHPGIGDGLNWISGKHFYGLVASTLATNQATGSDILNLFPVSDHFWFVSAGFVLLLELSSPLFLVPKFRSLYALLFLSFHLLTYVLMKIFFLDLAAIVLLVTFFPSKSNNGGNDDILFRRLLGAIGVVFLAIQLSLTFNEKDFFPFHAMNLYNKTSVYLHIEMDHLEFLDENGAKIELDFGKVWNYPIVRSFHFVKIMRGRRNDINERLLAFLYRKLNRLGEPYSRTSSIQIIAQVIDLKSRKVLEKNIVKSYDLRRFRAGDFKSTPP
jgi:hypothetical protein